MKESGMEALAKLILPKEIISNFEVTNIEEGATTIRIFLDESIISKYKNNPGYEAKGFREAVSIRDFPIRDKAVDLEVRRRRWLDKRTGKTFSNTYDLKSEGTRYSKEFADFLKELYGGRRDPLHTEIGRAHV